MARLRDLTRRHCYSLIAGALLAALVFASFARPRGPRDLFALRRHRAQLEARYQKLLAANAELKARLQRLGSDQAYLERLIRSELGYARADELVYRFAPDSAASQR